MKNILLCCNSMGIGGVETVILNQVTAFKSRGYNVFVIAGKGAYADKVKELGGEFIEIEFPEEKNINKDRVKNIVKLIEKKEITEIHIHKYQCIPSVLVAACITRTPYFAYEHGIKNTKEYYTWNYPIYRILFPIYFKNAYKIIAITPKVAEITKNEYGFSDEKYAIVHNGIDFNSYNNPNPNYNNSIKRVLIVSRIDKEKLPTIYNGIEAFKILKEFEPEAKLYIVGGGNAENDVIEYLNNAGLKSTYKNEDATVKLFGRQTDVKKYLKEADILLGVGRCILEAIAMKIPVAITGYEGINGLIKKENMNIAMEENFSGFNMLTVNKEEFLKDLLELKENKKKIIDEIYEIAKEHLDCYNNYITMPENQTLNFDWFQLFDILKQKTDLIEEQYIDIKLKYDWIQKIEAENKNIKEKNHELILEEERIQKNANLKEKELREKYQELILEKEIIQRNANLNEKELKEEINALQKEVFEIYNSKRWIYAEKLNKIFHKKNNSK